MDISKLCNIITIIFSISTIAFFATCSLLEDPDAEPSAPVAFQAIEISSNQIILSWNVSDLAEEYYIYRSSNPNNGWVKIGVTAQQIYSDTTIITGAVYYYKITGVSEYEVQDQDTDWIRRTMEHRGNDAPVKVGDTSSDGGPLVFMG